MFYDFWPFFKKFQEHRFFYTNWWMLQVFRVSENSGFFITAFFAKILALKGENHLFLHFFCNEQFFVMKTWQDIKKKTWDTIFEISELSLIHLYYSTISSVKKSVFLEFLEKRRLKIMKHIINNYEQILWN